MSQQDQKSRESVKWEEKDRFISFPLVKMTRDTAFFDRLTFRKLDQDTIQVFLAMQRNGEKHEIEFKYHRVIK
jgi:hypothetical protein